MPSARIDDRRHVAELGRAAARRFGAGLLVRPGRAADVEGPPCWLRPRRYARLGGDDANGFTDVDRRAARAVAAVAFAAPALLARAPQRRGDSHALETAL